MRGSSSQWYSPKKSYSLTTQDSTGANLNVGLLGMPADNDWVLSAVYSDKTMIRNALTYGIGRDAGSYASRTHYCEVVLDGVYQGVYTFMEKIKQGSNRVNISKLKSTDNTGDAVTGGYILKLDKTTGSPSASWLSKYQNPADTTENNILFQVDYPKLADITAPQRTYIEAYADSFETALSTKPFADARKGYRHYINTPSFVDYFLLTELTRNIDGYCFSTYFYKDRASKGGRLTMGPLWDYDLAWGNAGFCAGDSAAGWVYNNAHCSGHKIPFWWRQLLADSTFSQELRTRWTSLRTTVLSEDSLDQRIDANAAQLQESQARNYQAWPVLGTYVWADANAFATYQEEVDYVKRWTHERLLWMDGNLPRPAATALSSRAAVAFSDATAFPVPSATSLTVDYSLPQASAVTVVLLDVLGQPVYQQALTTQGIGNHEVAIAIFADLSPGVYSLRLTSNEGSRTLRVVRSAL
ncbi:CotH kinase family protein [Hymenobacter ginkgonis]|uniref:CotH kinase family protein n=1 Tax=Hymenobacter ginkgonis TaxID=2682976 RepID=UPI0018DEA8C2|nr:CotH kinase family protein [Hymenobacter ginkgonis]